MARARGKKRSQAGEGQSQTSFSFTVTTGAAPTGKSEEDELGFDWRLLKGWASGPDGLSVRSQARMLFEAEKKDYMTVEEAISKFVVIRRLLDDELKRTQP